MAAISTVAHQRRRKATTYGKSSRSTSGWDLGNFDTLEDHGRSKNLLAKEPSLQEKQKSSLSRGAHRSTAAKSAKQPERKQPDTWDVPSSEDEALSPIRVTSPPRTIVRAKPKVIEEEPEPKLAPWEEAREVRAFDSTNQSRSRQTRFSHNKSEDRPNVRLRRGVSEAENTQETVSASNDARLHKSEAVQAPDSGEFAGLSAAARLHAKRSLVNTSAKLRTDDLSCPPSGSQFMADLSRTDPHPRKRMRRGVRDCDEVDDVNMADAPPMPSYEDTDIYEFPDSSSNLETLPNTRADSDHTSKAGPARGHRGKKVLHPRSSNQPPDDSDTPKATSGSSSALDRLPVVTLPAIGSSDPPYTMSTTTNIPISNDDVPSAATPKQTDLWKKLLSNDASGPSPSTIPLQKLNITSSKDSSDIVSAPPSAIHRRQSFAERRKSRMVDRLKAMAAESDEEMSEHSETESGESLQDDAESDGREAAGGVRSQQTQSQSQSQGQSIRAVDGGPKITYARDRSYLREESLEEGLMLELSNETPHKPVPPAFQRMASKTAPQKSVFDLDESDDDESASRIRTIHELRAGGGNQRFMDDTVALLDDIADHNITARSRRRAALMDIAVNLSDRSYVEKFLRQGFEKRLIDACGRASDDIADFIIAASLVTLASSDLPEHTANSMKEGNYLLSLLRLLSVTSDIRMLARDRRSNMSKSAQSSFIEFVDKLAEQQSIWGESKPSFLTPRLVALKSMEQVIQKLRQLGDRSDLVPASEMTKIWPLETGQLSGGTFSVEHSLAISVLESLSTLIQSLTWPYELVQQLGHLIVLPETLRDDSRHTIFLALRLCLNLTTGNIRNCKALSANTMVHSLLRTIRSGFTNLDAAVQDEHGAIKLDILVLSMGILMNLAEHSDKACAYASNGEAAEILSDLVAICQHGHTQAMKAESEEESRSNVAYGYLAVTLAQLCRNIKTKDVIASRLPDKRLDALVVAVDEFVKYHNDVDRLDVAGEGMDTWSAFTEQLKEVLTRLKREAATA